MISALEPEEACSAEAVHRKGKHFLHWTAEVYSLGKTYRKAYGLDPDAYLPFTSDHGVTSCETGYESHEIASPLHLTFQEHRYRIYEADLAVRRWNTRRRTAPKRVIRVQHPYVNYLSEMRIPEKRRRKGTLVFFPHSIPSEAGYQVEDVDRFMTSLRDMPHARQPVSLMVHYHDVRRGILDVIRGHGVPVLSAGNPMHPDFVDRLVEAICLHSAVGATFVGTEAFVCSLLGVKFQLLSETEAAKGFHHGLEFLKNDPNTIDRIVSQHMSIGVKAQQADVHQIRKAAVRGRQRWTL